MQDDPEFPCPAEGCDFKEAPQQFWAKAKFSETRGIFHGQSYVETVHTCEAIAFSLVSQADAQSKAETEARDLVDRKFTHAVSPVGSRQLSAYKDRWF